MGRKAKYSKELKVEIVKKYLKGESASILANEYGLSKGMRRHILEWANQYKALGEKVFEEKSTNKAYTKEFKEQVIKEYFEGRFSDDSYIKKTDRFFIYKGNLYFITNDFPSMRQNIYIKWENSKPSLK